MTAIAESSQRINLPRPHSDGQMKLITDTGNSVAFCGRRWGKTMAGVQRILRSAVMRPGLYWWVGLSWKSASMKRAWRLLKFFTRQIYRALGLSADGKIREVEREIYLPNGAAIWLRTAENVESLAGEGIHGAVVDEFTLMREAVWTEYLEATLLDYDGWAMFIGVPKGNNWGARLWRQAAGRDGWTAYHFTSYDNPRLKAEKIAEIEANTASGIFQQEYLAQILDDGALFRGVRDCVYGAPGKPSAYEHHAEHRHVGGEDWGQQNDFTVIATIDVETKCVAPLERFNQIAWQIQRDRTVTTVERYGITYLLAELNSIGSPNIEALQQLGLPIAAFLTTNETKAEIVQALMLAIERKEITIPNDPVLIAELEAFEATRLPSGKWKYSAPDGMHDDCVMALALAWWAAQGPAPRDLVDWA